MQAAESVAEAKVDVIEIREGRHFSQELDGIIIPGKVWIVMQWTLRSNH